MVATTGGARTEDGDGLWRIMVREPVQADDGCGFIVPVVASQALPSCGDGAALVSCGRGGDEGEAAEATGSRRRDGRRYAAPARPLLALSMSHKSTPSRPEAPKLR